MVYPSAGKIYLIPSLLGKTKPDLVLPAQVQEVCTSLRLFFAEDVRSARRFLRVLDPQFPIDDSSFHILNKHSRRPELEQLLTIVRSGSDAGILSEAGLPAVADPGASIVQMAQEQDIRVIPLTGPSSIFLALMASGLNGQHFAFHGYLPIKEKERNKSIRSLEENARKQGRAEVFMETPYRNNKLTEALIRLCHPETLLCIAASITTKEEYIRTRKIAEWKGHLPDLHKKPAIFILESGQK